MPLFTEHVTAQRVGPEPIRISERAKHPAPDCLSQPPPLPLARSDPRGRGGRRNSDARTPNVTHTRAMANSTNVVLSLRARLGMSRSILCYSQLWDGELLQPGDGSKWFDPKTSSTRDAAVPQFMTNPYHTQKIDSEPSGMKMFMQKSDSPDATLSVTFMITFMVTNNTHIRLPRHALKNRQSRDNPSFI